ncbi:MAG: DUF1376 domain-containing protein [Hyphomicrobiaceae bacterium]|nr:MAG: DUF1376 domain-containing protein [Hyphomicrobiaceae bacterium]
MEWFPHYIEAYDTDTLHLTPAQDGVYHRLLRWYYEKERALPADDISLAAIARIGMDDWLPMSAIIRAFFETRVSRVTNAATLHQKRANAYILKQNAKRRDGKARQEKFRKNNMMGDDYDVSRVTNAADRNKREIDKTQSPTTPTEQTTKTESSESIGERVKKTEGPKIAKPDLDAMFEQWWSKVPRKVGKDAARKAFGRALNRTDFPTLLGGILRYAAERSHEDPQFTAHPSTWLNAGRWADDPEPRHAGPGPHRNGRDPDSGLARFLNRRLGAGGQPDLPDLGGEPAGVPPVRTAGSRPKPGPIPGFGPGETIVEPDAEG